MSSQAHMSFKNNFLVIRTEEIRQIHLSEINTIIIDNNMSTISTYLLNELINNNIKIIFCNSQHNPNMELVPYNYSFESSRIIFKQISWNLDIKKKLWKSIIESKILKQSELLKKNGLDEYIKLEQYSKEVVDDDLTNREGHAAKVYFNSLFGNKFNRDDDNNQINSLLNYGYTIILSVFNRALVSHGYMTQLGIHHKGPTNPFNLSCDLMEPFRTIIDNYAISHRDQELNSNNKIDLINLINKKIVYLGKEYYFHNAVDIYINSVLSCFETGEIKEEWFYYCEK